MAYPPDPVRIVGPKEGVQRNPAELFALREPVRPTTREEALALLRHRADIGRRSGLRSNFWDLPPEVQAVMYGMAAQLEYVADFFESLTKPEGA